jgi:hypothetical protein
MCAIWWTKCSSEREASRYITWPVLCKVRSSKANEEMCLKRFLVLTAIKMSLFFWVVVLCGLEGKHQSLEGLEDGGSLLHPKQWCVPESPHCAACPSCWRCSSRFKILSFCCDSRWRGMSNLRCLRTVWCCMRAHTHTHVQKFSFVQTWRHQKPETGK